MGVLTFEELTSYTKFQIGGRRDVESATDESANLHGVWVNFAYKALCNQNRFHGLRINYTFPELMIDNTGTNTTAGTTYVDTPATILGTPHEVFDETSNVHLKWRPWSWYVDKTDRDTEASRGNPKYWTIYGAGATAGTKRMYLYSTPDNTYSIYIYFRKKALTLTGTSVTLIGEEWDQIILQMAVCEGYKWLREWSNYDKELAIVQEAIAGIIGHEQVSELARKETIQPSSAYSQLDYYQSGK